MIVFVRRRKLGNGSTRGISGFMTTPNRIHRIDRPGLNLTADDLLVRWGCTNQIDHRNVLNKVSAIHEVNDKSAFRMKMFQNDLAPKTIVAGYSLAEMLDYFNTGKKMVVRPQSHAQGRNVHVVSNCAELDAAVGRCGAGWYASELIQKTAEYRVFVGSGRAVWVARKTPGNPNQVAWNVAQGGRFDNVRFGDWPLKVVKKAIEAFTLTELDFGGVDVMVDAQNNCYILEINSAPSQTSPYRQECVAKFMDYVYTNGKERIPLMTERGGYTKFIHPAITQNAG